MLFPGCGGKHVHQLEGSAWKIVVDLQLTLPAKTLIYAEVSVFMSQHALLNAIFTQNKHLQFVLLFRY